MIVIVDLFDRKQKERPVSFMLLKTFPWAELSITWTVFYMLQGLYVIFTKPHDH